MNAVALLREGLDEVGGPCEHLRPFQLAMLAIVGVVSVRRHLYVDLSSQTSVSCEEARSADSLSRPQRRTHRRRGALGISKQQPARPPCSATLGALRAICPVLR